MVNGIVYSLPSEKGKLVLDMLPFLPLVKDIICEEDYIKHISRKLFSFLKTHFKNQSSCTQILAIPSKKSKSCKSSGSRGRTSAKSSWFNSKSCGMSVISLAMSSGNSSALSSGVDGLLGQTTALVLLLPCHLPLPPPRYAHQTRHGKSNSKHLLSYYREGNLKAKR